MHVAIRTYIVLVYITDMLDSTEFLVVLMFCCRVLARMAVVVHFFCCKNDTVSHSHHAVEDRMATVRLVLPSRHVPSPATWPP